MSEQAPSLPAEESELEGDVEAVIAMCGSERAAIRALLVANEFLSAELERAKG
jgi:hypothetical protein